MSQRPELSVVMATYNRAETVKGTLAHLAAQTLDTQCFEVIVIDDGSSDHTQQVVEAFAEASPFKIRYMRHSNRGPGYTQNCGIEVAEAPIVLLIADDILLTPPALAAHLAMHAQHPEIECASLGRVVQRPDEGQSVFLQKWDPFRFSRMEGSTELPYYRFWACNISSKREFFARAGMFNEARGPGGAAAHEDAALGSKLAKSGLRILYCPEALGYHDHVVTLHSACRRGYEQGLNFPDFRRYVAQPEISVVYHVFNRSTAVDHLRAWFGQRRKYLAPGERNPIRLLALYAVRTLAFNSMTVPLFWQTLAELAEKQPALARHMRASFYRGIIAYHFRKGCRDGERGLSLLQAKAATQ
jgi:glycosyltransferase involved in cell wall biosynthesis